MSSVGSTLDGSGAVDASGSAASVCAPPLLLIVMPGSTSAVDDVAPDVCVVLVVVAVDEVEVPAVNGPSDAVDDSLGVLLDVESAELDAEDDSEDAPVVSAAATP